MIRLILDLLLNSRHLALVLIFIVMLAFGCGVKSDPRPPQDTILPSIEDTYMGQSKVLEKKDKDKDKDAKIESEKQSP